MSVEQKRARILAGGTYKGRKYERAQILRIEDNNIVFRRIKNKKGNSNIQVLGLVPDSKVGDFQLEYVSSSGKWIENSNGPTKDDAPQIWEFEGENDAEYKPFDFRNSQETISKLLDDFTDGPITFFHD